MFIVIILPPRYSSFLVDSATKPSHNDLVVDY
jgi:hypothetical protein